MNWDIDESIIVVSTLPHIVEVSHEVISLLHQLERGQEAVGGSGGVSLRIFLQGHDPSIKEGNNVVPVKGLAFEVHPFLWLVIFTILGFLGEAVEGGHDAVEAN